MWQRLMFPHPSFGFGLKVGTEDVQNVEKERAFQQEQCESSRAARGPLGKDAQGFDVAV
jgi:hypothetical protein